MSNLEKVILLCDFRKLAYSHTHFTGNPIPRPKPGHELKCNTSKPYHAGDTCFPTDFAEGQEWALDQVFGRSVEGACPLTDPEIPPVCIQVPHSRDIFTTAGATEIKSPRGGSRCYKLPSDDTFSLILPRMSRDDDDATKTDASDELIPLDSPQLYAERSLMGHGQERGGVQSILTNPSPDTAVEFVYFESLPWFMRVYLHTLRTRIETADQHHQPSSSEDSTDIIREIYYRPALDRVRGSQLELRVRIPPASRVVLTYDFEKTILRYTEYPPDANRGFDVAAAVITILDDSGDDYDGSTAATTGTLRRRGTSNLRTTGLLLSLPTPDFSMPYNVIIFTSTCIALAFGGLYNILVRRFVAADEVSEVGAGGLKGKVLYAAKKIVGLVKEKLAASASKSGSGGGGGGGDGGKGEGQQQQQQQQKGTENGRGKVE